MTWKRWHEKVVVKGYRMGFLQNFHFQIYGEESARRLVFLHGLMGSGANWRRIVPFFQDRYQILALDQRGHGQSFHPESGYAPEDYARDLGHILDELQWGAVFLVGHSMGGRNALHFAYANPQRVRALVMEDIAPSHVESVPHSFYEEMLNKVPVPFPSARAAKEYFLNDFVREFAEQPRVHQLGQFLYSNIITDAHGQGVWRFSPTGVRASALAGRNRDRWFELEKIAVPTLIIRGEDSRDLPRSDFERAVHLSPFVSGVEIPSAGHWVHIDQSEAFCRAVDHFFSGMRQIA